MSHADKLNQESEPTLIISEADRQSVKLMDQLQAELENQEDQTQDSQYDTMRRYEDKGMNQKHIQLIAGMYFGIDYIGYNG